MSHTIHRAVVVCCSVMEAGELMAEAQLLGLSFSELSAEKTNGCRYFMILPCGSKEGWAEAKFHRLALRAFLNVLRGKEVEYGFVIFGRAEDGKILRGQKSD